MSYGISINHANETVFSSGLFNCIEFSCGCASFVNENAFDILGQELEKVKAMSKKYNVPIRSCHLPFNGGRLGGAYPFVPSSFDEWAREYSLSNTKRIITMLEGSGVEYVILHGSLRILNEERPQRMEALIDYIQKLCDFCKPYGISVALETLLPVCMGTGSDEHLYIMEHANRDNLGICFDSNHFLTENNLDFLRKAGQYVVTTHLSDYDGIYERHWFPGKGIIEWKKIKELLAEKGYTGPYVFEVGFANRGKPTIEELRTLISEWERVTK